MFRSSLQTPRSGDPESIVFAFEALDKLAPSKALALRATCGVRVGDPANAVRFRGNDDKTGWLGAPRPSVMVVGLSVPHCDTCEA
jgi:hypothetical protein